MDSFWRPFTQEALSNERINITSAKGAYLYDKNGNQYLDCISSWWTTNHGHCNDKISTAISEQVKILDHIIAADLSNEPSHLLIEELKKHLSISLSKFFFSDNGSTAMEVAMKIAYQYWINNKKKKKYFITFNNGYHGDTLGAMSLGKTSHFFIPFYDIMYKHVLSIDFPETWQNDKNIEMKENKSIEQFIKIIKKHKNNIICLIVEPLIQGAAGMKFCSINFMNKLCKIAKQNNIIIIFDEVMTAFGRTGKMFAYQHLEYFPDIISFSKGITGGFLPLGLTVTTHDIYSAFFDKEISKAFLHGHSYTANPIICTAAYTAISLFDDYTFKKINLIESWYHKYIVQLKNIEKIRILGNICAFDIKNINSKYQSNFYQEFKKLSFNNGFILRPLGSTIYIMPPFCIEEIDIVNIFKFFLKCNF